MPQRAMGLLESTVEFRRPRYLPGLTSFEIAHGGTCHTDNQSFYIEIDGSLVLFASDKPLVDLWVKEPYDIAAPVVTQLLSHALSPRR
jgi:hypothetical protein